MVFLGLHLHWRELFKIVWLFLVPKSIWIIIFWINKSIWICFVVLSCQLSISIFRICLGIYGTSILKIDWFLMWSLILSGTGCHVFPNLHMVLLLQAKRTYASASEKVFFTLYICVYVCGWCICFDLYFNIIFAHTITKHICMYVRFLFNCKQFIFFKILTPTTLEFFYRELYLSFEICFLQMYQ